MTRSRHWVKSPWPSNLNKKPGKKVLRHFGIIAASALLLLGCDSGDRAVVAADTTLKLYVFDCGKIRLSSIASFSIDDSEIDIRDLAVPCYVIEHPKGRLLWDGGLSSTYADTQGWQGEGSLLRLDRTLSDQFDDIGFNMGSFDYIAFSHSHFDHIGVANELQGGRLLIQQAEYDAAFADEVTLPATNPSLYVNLKNAPRTMLEGDHDVFGDGRVMILSAPGHTPGHQVLYVNLANHGPVVLSGDLYHFRFSRENRRIPTFNVDTDTSAMSIDKIEAFLAESQAELWIQHDLERFERQRKSPAFYD